MVQPVEPEELVATVRALLRVAKKPYGSRNSNTGFFLKLLCVSSTADLWVSRWKSAAVKQYGYSREEFMRLTLRNTCRTKNCSQ